ncbi:LysR family transcriptional regulator [Sulfuriferula thiophila]|uniref:LysR family transcriptional regulator n=1 Tax=Sulfuriferula thiophila TaxID=1781211 RepID=UPI000F611F00|nr:LysR family transcriptional regulator [Sulfuriferula thiophila]
MKHATLHQLKIFEVVARNLSFTRAAEELHLTQPTVSIQMKQLTEIVGLPLLEQVGKRIFLTEAGRELLGVSNSLFEGLSRFEMLVSDMKGVKAGKLRVGVISTAKYFVPRLLGPFCDLYPGIEVSIKVTNRERLIQRMMSNEDDLYILGQMPEHMDVWVEPFLDNPLVVIAPHTHVLAGQKNISAQRIAEEPFLMRESGSGTRLATEAYFKERGLPIKVRMELGSNEAIKQAVAGGLGVSVLSAHTLALEKSGDDLAVLDVEGFPIPRQWHVAYSNGKQLSVVARAFLEFLQKESGPMAERYMKDFPGFSRQGAKAGNAG